jgi:hypothetical protein
MRHLEMKRILTAAILFVMVSALSLAADTKVKSVLDENLDLKTIKTLIEHGQLFNMIYNDKGELAYRMCAVLVYAPPDLVWKVITDFKNYDKFVPDMLPPVLRNEKKNEITVDFTLKISIVMGISTTQKYSTRYVLSKPMLYMYDTENKLREPGFWKLVPVDDDTRTMLFYYDAAPDLSKMGKLVDGVTKAKPEFALALQVSPVSILVNEAKAYIEKKNKK